DDGVAATEEPVDDVTADEPRAPRDEHVTRGHEGREVMVVGVMGSAVDRGQIGRPCPHAIPTLVVGLNAGEGGLHMPGWRSTHSPRSCGHSRDLIALLDTTERPTAIARPVWISGYRDRSVASGTWDWLRAPRPAGSQAVADRRPDDNRTDVQE